MTPAVVVAHVWHVEPATLSVRCAAITGKPRLSWDGGVGAGDGNRTRMTSLEGWGSAIELRPHDLLRASGGPRAGR